VDDDRALHDPGPVLTWLSAGGALR
jgi:hypothetical protein